jgi:hypothetical protein
MIWIEILSRHHEVASRFRMPGPEVRIGRGYNNDVIVDDPYVAAEHLQLFRDQDGRLVVQDLGSANGVYLNESKQRSARIIVDGKQSIRIGQTFLRIREGNFAVEPEQVGSPERNGLLAMLAVALGLALIAFNEVGTWLSLTSEVQLTTYLAPPFAMSIIVLVWAGIWTLVSRVFSGRSRFLRNLLITLTGALSASIYNGVAQFVSYSLTWSAPVTYGFAALWAIVAVMCFFHLAKIGPPRPWLKGSGIATLLVAIVTVQTLQQSEAVFTSGRQNTARPLMPPSLRIAPLHDEATFFGDIAKLKAKLDEDRLTVRSGDLAGGS